MAEKYISKIKCTHISMLENADGVKDVVWHYFHQFAGHKPQVIEISSYFDH